MPPERIIYGQNVTDSQRENARRLRRVMTTEEHLLWEQVRGRKLAGWKFRRQQIIHGFYADFYCHAAALVVEIDGAQHLARWEYDSERSQVFGRVGIAVIRFSNAEVQHELEKVLERIKVTCAERQAQLTLPHDPAD